MNREHPTGKFTSGSSLNSSAECDDARSCLKDIQDEMMTRMESAVARVIVVPLFVVDRNPHLWRIPVVHAIATTEVLLPPEILGIVYVRIVIKPIPVAEIGLSTPGAAVGPLVSRSIVGQSDVTA